MIHQVKDIIIYPIKGCAGIHLQEAEALTTGFENDRRYMLIDHNHKFITQRTSPKMALFHQKIEGDILSISLGGSTISISLVQVENTVIETKVWDDVAMTQAVSKDADEWFSHHLGQNVKLVKLVNEYSRIHYSSVTDQKYPVSLADGYPYLVIGEESLHFLNNKMVEPVLMNRFRPNIVVSTATPHEEDDWRAFRIGEAAFTNIKPCGRCSVITIDQSTGKINIELLRVLSTYRKKDNSVLFGTNIVCYNSGRVSVGDSVVFN